MTDYNYPYCGWGQQQALGRSANVDIVIKDGQVALVDAEDFIAEVECEECGKFYDIVYPHVGTVEQFAQDIKSGQHVSQQSMKREINI